MLMAEVCVWAFMWFCGSSAAWMQSLFKAVSIVQVVASDWQLVGVGVGWVTGWVWCCPQGHQGCWESCFQGVWFP